MLNSCRLGRFTTCMGSQQLHHRLKAKQRSEQVGSDPRRILRRQGRDTAPLAGCLSRLLLGLCVGSRMQRPTACEEPAALHSRSFLSPASRGKVPLTRPPPPVRKPTVCEEGGAIAREHCNPYEAVLPLGPSTLHHCAPLRMSGPWAREGFLPLMLAQPSRARGESQWSPKRVSPLAPLRSFSRLCRRSLTQCVSIALFEKLRSFC
jgi:hypothetical protein